MPQKEEPTHKVLVRERVRINIVANILGLSGKIMVL
jgi:hypothetical protein